MSCSTTIDGLGPGDVAQQIGGIGGFLVGHAGGRLVDQQELRLLRQQHADLEPLLLAVGQFGRLAMALAREADALQQGVDPLPLAEPCAARAGSRRARGLP